MQVELSLPLIVRVLVTDSLFVIGDFLLEGIGILPTEGLRLRQSATVLEKVLG